MNQQAETVRIRHEELDREIETILAERRLDAKAASRPALPARARAGLGRGLISLGTALVGRAESATPTSSQRVGGGA